jgi:hypothetical protein
MELQLFKNRLELSLGVYRSLNSAQLLYNALSEVTGFDRVLENGNTIVENKGLEMTLRYTPFRNPDLSWNLMAKATYPKSSLRRFDGIENTPYNETLKVGHPITSVKLYRFGGADPLTGNFFFLDKNGNPVTAVTSDDQTVIMDTDPRFYGSLTSSFRYKRLSLDVDCIYMVRWGRTALENNAKFSAGFMQNQTVEVLSRWQKPGDRTNVAKYTQDYSRLLSQGYPKNYDILYTNASYLRLKNISLSYSFRKVRLERLQIENLRFYLLGQNVFTLSAYKDLDPETSFTSLINTGSRMPILRTLTAGFQITF